MKVGADEKENLGISHGVKVTGLRNGAVREAGVKDGFIILEVNGKNVTSSDDVEAAYNAAMKTDEKVLLFSGIYPSGKKYYYAVNLSEQ